MAAANTDGAIIKKLVLVFVKSLPPEQYHISSDPKIPHSCMLWELGA